MTLNISGSSSLPMSDAVQQSSSEPVHRQHSSSQLQYSLATTHAHAVTTTMFTAGTPLLPDVSVEREEDGFTFSAGSLLKILPIQGLNCCAAAASKGCMYS